MKQPKSIAWFIMAIVSGCQAMGQTMTEQNPNQFSRTNTSPGEVRTSDADYQQNISAGMAESQSEYEAMIRNASATSNRAVSHRPLPNFQAGPLRPRPAYLNFYHLNDARPDYLLCEYRVDEISYNQANEPKWFKAALTQIRHSGKKKFPPIKWVAVVIRNGVEHKGASTFEQSFKVGAIFKASDVFNRWRRLSPLVAQTRTDRHPFHFDQSRPTPGEQQRWTIVERHAAANHSVGKTN
jgi:hypothetical protein